MKKSILSAALLTLFGVSQAYAQEPLSLSWQSSPTPAPRLVATQSDNDVLGFSSDLASDSLGTAELADNPFDFLEGSASTPRSERSHTNSANPNGSHPVSRSNTGQQVINSIVDHAHVSQIPHVSASPVNWAQHCPRQPIADFMMQEDCVAGLWNGYEAQRAAECAAKWERIAGHHRGCGGCKGCATNSCGGCASQGCAPTGCATGRCGGGVINRYTNQTHFHGSAGCDSHPQPMVGCPSCGIHASPISGPTGVPAPHMNPTPNSVPVAPAPAIHKEATNAPAAHEMPNVAFQPSYSLHQPLIR